MLKLKKYLKPFILSIVSIIVLLFVQAMCELSLPDYMSDIVNKGIMSSGVDTGVSKVLPKDDFEHLQLFMNDKEMQIFKDSYTLYDIKNESYDEMVESYPQLKDSSFYILNDLDKKSMQELNKVLAFPSTALLSLTSGNNEQIQLPEGMNVFDMLEMMDDQTKEAMITKFKSQMENMGDSMMESSAIQYVVSVYEKSGVDMETYQRNYIFYSGFKMLVIALFGSIASISVSYLSAKVGSGLSKNLRKDIFTKVENFSNAEFNKFSPATLITRTTNDVQQVQMVTIMMMRMVIYAPIMGIGALIKVLNTNVSMSWIIALILVIILSIIGVGFTFVLPKFKVIQKLTDKLNLVMKEALEGMLVIRAFNTSEYEEKKFDQVNKEITDVNMFVKYTMSAIFPLMMFVMNCASLLIVWVGAKQIDMGNIQIGEMLAFIQYAMQIIMSFVMISMVSIMIPRASVSAGRIVEVIETESEIKDPVNPLTFDENKKGFVEFKNVSFAYPGGEEDVLHDISFVAKPGETCAFIGSTGSGKSTLIQLIPRFFDVKNGEIHVNGVNVKDVTQHDLRERIGFVPQKGVLFSGTIGSNLYYANENASDSDIETAISVAQAKEFIDNKPDGLDSEIAQSGTNVSGGQKQRLSIARALVKKADIFIFDDSFSALDFKTDAKLRKELKLLCEKTKSTVFIVAQRISTIMHADQIVVLDNGKIAGIGKHDDLMKTCKVYQEIAYSQLSKEELGHE